jgi:hypothetical protein
MQKLSAGAGEDTNKGGSRIFFHLLDDKIDPVVK